MNLNRLIQMTPAEISYRSWQEASKVLDRLGADMGDEQPLPNIFEELVLEDIAAIHNSGNYSQAESDLLSRWQWLSPNRFFPGTDDPEVPLELCTQYLETCQQIIRGADRIMEGVFPVLGYRNLKFGDPVDWHFDPLSNTHSPRTHFSKINPLDSAQVGDHKVIWELNRQQWALELAQAWQISRNRAYADKAVALIREWMQENKPGSGINWTSALEASMRIITWCWALSLLRRSPALTQTFYREVLTWVEVHARYIERYLSRYYSPNTHLTGEALGLYYAGTMFPELKAARKWARHGRSILLQELEKQVFNDGVYFEQSTRYQYYTLEIYLHFIILSQKNRQAIDHAKLQRVARMVEFLISLRQPNGEMPLIGDADGGWLLPLMRREPADFSALFSLAAVLFQREDFAWAAKEFAPETLWFLGHQASSEFTGLRASPPKDGRLTLYEQGGYAVIRSGWEADAQQLIFDIGPLGCPHSGGHGHADLLSIQCAAFGEPLMVDAGTFTYYPGSKWRDYFRSTQAHNTLTIDGQSQALPNGPFSWSGKRPAASLRGYREEARYVLVDAEHHAYSRLADPVTHRRRVIFVENKFWVIIDDVLGRQPHAVACKFQLARHANTVRAGENWTRASNPGGAGLFIAAFGAPDLHSQVHTGSLDPIDGWVSADYGERSEAPALTFSSYSNTPLRLATVLIPTRDADDAVPVVTSEIDGVLRGLDIRTATLQIHMEINDDTVSVCDSKSAAQAVNPDI